MSSPHRRVGLGRRVALSLLIACGGIGATPGPVAQDHESQAPDAPPALASTAFLRGRVLGRDGVPAAGLRLLVRPVPLDCSDGRLTYEEAEFRRTTDAEGAFEVRGLAPGVPCVVRARTDTHPGSGPFYPHLLTGEPCVPSLAKDAPELRLSFSRPHILLRVLDEDGRPWSVMDVNPGEAKRTAEWRRFPSPFLVESRSSDVCTGIAIDRGLVVYEVEASSTYFAGVSGGPFDGSVQRIEMPAETDRVEIERRPQRFELGSVSVRVTSGGREIGLRSEDPAFTVVLESLAGAVAMLEDGPYRHGPPFLLSAPPGDYRLVVRGYAITEPYHGGLVVARELGQADAAIHLESGASLEIRLELDRGARLELSLKGEGKEAEFDSWPEAFSAERQELVADLSLVSATGTVEGIFRRWEGPYQPNLVARWPLGKTLLSECLPAGHATIRARLKSGRETLLEVDLRAGETTRATLTF